jgi:hypothetical protein
MDIDSFFLKEIYIKWHLSLKIRDFIKVVKTIGVEPIWMIRTRFWTPEVEKINFNPFV